jgi:ABC-type antimicrobial peptide transport system permease subunit
VGFGVALGSLPGAVLLAGGAPAVLVGFGRPFAAVATVIVGTFVLGIAIVACIVPTRRALGVQPTEALRSE